MHLPSKKNLCCQLGSGGADGTYIENAKKRLGAFYSSSKYSRRNPMTHN
jgi:hypothetical protein